MYVNPIETAQALIREGPVLDGRSMSYLESSRLEDIEGSWQVNLIEEIMTELPARRINASRALSAITQLTKGPGTVLDIGCQCGVFLTVAAEHGWDCHGLEPLFAPAIYARARFGLRVVTDTLGETTYPPEFFDVVTAFQVFEHLIDPAREVAYIRRCLKPGGLLVVEVPDIASLWVKVFGARHRHFVEDHVSFFSACTLNRLLTRMGFRVRRILHPARTLTLRHLAWWVGRHVHSASGDYLARAASRLHLDSRTVRVNLRDILMVIAEKAT